MKFAEIHDVCMAVSGESVCEEVHPCRVNMIYSNNRVRGYGLPRTLIWFIDNLKWIL